MPSFLAPFVSLELMGDDVERSGDRVVRDVGTLFTSLCIEAEPFPLDIIFLSQPTSSISTTPKRRSCLRTLALSACLFPPPFWTCWFPLADLVLAGTSFSGTRPKDLEALTLDDPQIAFRKSFLTKWALKVRRALFPLLRSCALPLFLRS